MDSLVYHLDSKLLTVSGSSWPVSVLRQSDVFLLQNNKLLWNRALNIRLFSLVAKKITCHFEDWSIHFPVHDSPSAILFTYYINLAHTILSILGAFGKLRKETVSFVLSVHPFSEWIISSPTGRIFMGFDISIRFENLLRKSKFH